MKKETNQPNYGDKFWHKKYNEFCYYTKTMPNGNYLVGLNLRLRDDDNYYSYNPKELKKA